jgi:hypothetical protein
MTLVVSFNDVLSLQFTMYVSYLLINVIMSIKCDNSIKADQIIALRVFKEHKLIYDP